MTTTPTLDDCLALASLSQQFGTVERATQHPDGRAESDSTHTVMLGLLAQALAPHEAVPLYLGLLAQLAYVHDLAEAYAGDTNTAGGLDADQRRAKAEREALALARIRDELRGMPGVLRLVDLYEDQVLPEARWLRYLDKVLPKLTHCHNRCAAVQAMGMTLADVQHSHRTQGAELRATYPEYTLLHDLFDAAAHAAEACYVDNHGQRSVPPPAVYYNPTTCRYYLVTHTLQAGVGGVVITPWSERRGRRRRGEVGWSGGQVPTGWHRVRNLPEVDVEIVP